MNIVYRHFIWTLYHCISFTSMYIDVNVSTLVPKLRCLILLFSVLGGVMWFWMESLHKNIQLILEFLNAAFLVLHSSYFTIFFLFLLAFLMMLPVILLSVLMILLSTLSLIRHSDLWKYLELAAQLESDLRDTVDWAGNNLLILMLEKLSRFCFTGLITLVLLMWKWMGLVLRKNHIFRFWVWLFVLNWIGALTLCLLLKLPPKKLWPWFVPLSFFLLRLLCISINLPYGQAWNTVVISGLVLLVVTWNC